MNTFHKEDIGDTMKLRVKGRKHLWGKWEVRDSLRGYQRVRLCWERSLSNENMGILSGTVH